MVTRLQVKGGIAHGEPIESLRDRLEALEKQTSVSRGVAYKGIQEEPWETNISFAKVVVRAAIVLVLSVATVVLAPSPSWAQVRLFVRFDELGSCGGSTVSVFLSFGLRSTVGAATALAAGDKS